MRSYSLRRSLFACLTVGILFICARNAHSQLSSSVKPNAATVSFAAVPVFDTQDLNLRGSDAQMPRFEETITGVDNSFRRAMFSRGFALRMNVNPTYSQNLLDPPVANSKQAYVGEREFGSIMLLPILTSDMRWLHLKDAQLYLSFAYKDTSWYPAGPNAAALNSLYVYKSLANGRLEMKGGYMFNHVEFVGMQVGGSVSSGTLGVYAVLPYEVGMSFLPVATPSFNIKWNAPAHYYAKVGFQRSTDAAGSAATVVRNPSGFRFDPKGDGLLTILEGGYRVGATAGTLQTWIRGGYLRNRTSYANSLTGGTSSDNFCAYLLGDHQLTRTEEAQPARGLYGGGSAMVTPAKLTKYDRFYEARLYLEGPFRSRPNDMIALVADHSTYSPDTIRGLVAAGKSVWHNSNSINASYIYRPWRGVFLNAGLSYVTGPALTPHVPNALVVSLQSNIFF